MNSLLPIEYENKLKTERVLRMYIFFILTLSAMFAFGFIFLLPNYYSLRLSDRAVMDQLDAEEKLVSHRNIKDLEKQISEINQTNLNFKKNESKRYSLSPLLLSISTIVPSNVYFDNIKFGQNDKNEFMLTIQGDAENRQAFLSYFDRLQKETKFSFVKSPISNLLHENRPLFNLEIGIKPEVYKYVPGK